MTSFNRFLRNDPEFKLWRKHFDAQTSLVLRNSSTSPNSRDGRAMIRSQRNIMNTLARRGSISKRRSADRIGLFTDAGKASATRRLQGTILARTRDSGSWSFFRAVYEVSQSVA